MELGINNKYIMSRLTYNEEYDVHTALTVKEAQYLVDTAKKLGIPAEKIQIMLADCVRIRLESFILEGLLTGALVPKYLEDTESIAYVDPDDTSDNKTILLDIPAPSEVELSPEVEKASEGDISHLFPPGTKIH